MKNFRYLLLALLLATASCEDATNTVDLAVDPVATTGISGEVYGTWAKGSVKKITGDIIIPAGKRLVIEEGVTVEMDPERKPEFIVQGNLYCRGTEQNPVRITTTPEFRKADSWGQNWGGSFVHRLQMKYCSTIPL